MIKYIKNLFKRDKQVKMVMFWDGNKVVHRTFTKSEYKYLMGAILPNGFSILSEMDL